MESVYTTNKDVISGKKKIIYNAGVEASLDYAEPKKTISNNIQLLFSPFGLPFIPIEVLGTDIGSIISNFTYQKDRVNPGGFVTVEITPTADVIKEMVDLINKISGNLYSKIWGQLGVDLEDLFKPMTMCQVWINGLHIFTGYVRSCHRNSNVTNNSSQISYSLTIDELGNLYAFNITSLTKILLDGMQTNVSDDIKKALVAVSGLKAVPLSVGLQILVNAFVTNTLANYCTLSDGFPMAYRLIALANPLGGIGNNSFARNMTVDINMFQMAGGQSFWQYIKNFVPNPFMEMFTETGGRTMVIDPYSPPSVLFPGFNYMVARSVPYSNPLLGTFHPYHAELLQFDLNALNMLLYGDFVIITDEIIQNKTLGFDSSNQNTSFRVTYSSGGVNNCPDLNAKPVESVGPLNPFASGGIGTFGVREMEQTVNCTNLVGFGVTTSALQRIFMNKKGTLTTLISKAALGNLLAVWFRNQSRFREGTVTTKMIPYAKPGMYCLYLPTLSGRKPENLRDIGIYYIDAVNHNYSLQNNSVESSTTLNLIRGVPLPTSVAQTALLLFDFEIVPPMTGIADGEYSVLAALRAAAKKI